MYHRRPRIKQEKTTSEQQLAEEQRLKDEAEVMKRTLTGARGGGEDMSLAEIYGTEIDGTEESAPWEPLVGQPNSKRLLSKKIVLAAASVAVVIVVCLLTYVLVGID